MAEENLTLTQVVGWQTGTLPGGNVSLLIEGFPDEASFLARMPVIYRFGLSSAQADAMAAALMDFAGRSRERERRETGHA